VLFGSIIGDSAFIYVVKNLQIAIASIYYFVNPVVAVLLGWLFFREPFGLHAAIAMLIIFVGIGVVRWSERPKPDTRLLVDTEEAGVIAE
jgi:drug/metabolite transporter (DMT)-like permease